MGFVSERSPVDFRLPDGISELCSQGGRLGAQILSRDLDGFAQLVISLALVPWFAAQPLRRDGPIGQCFDDAGCAEQHLGVLAAGHHAGEPSQEVDSFRIFMR